MKKFLKSIKTRVLNLGSRRKPLVTVVRLNGAIGSAGGFRQGLNFSTISDVLTEDDISLFK